MKRRIPLIRSLKLAVFLLPALVTIPALAAVQGPYSVEVLVDGTPLGEYDARGATYVEALEGCEYSVRLRNHTPRRVAVALAIDGLNSIDAKTTTAGAASKWILGPYDSITLDGWQTSKTAARRFFFTTEERSYGSWLGKTDNLGIISAVFFREKQPRPIPYSRSKERKGRRDSPAEPEAQGRMRKAGEGADRDALAPAPSDDYAATGIGTKIDHNVRRIRFESEKRPVAVLGIRYEYRDALVRLGVLPRGDDALARRERSRGFEDIDFAPDPWSD